MEKINFNDHFIYKNGELFWKHKKQGRNLNKPIKGFTVRGYRRVHLYGKFYYCHRIIYEMHHGEIPDNLQIDHIDRNQFNNNLENLRLATVRENSQNRASKGFSWSKAANKWVAIIVVDGASRYLGLYETELDARAAYLRERKKFFGKFA